ncbi:MAG: hypothetical protein NVSMB2_25480 [Chloroflexota bacterium]
MAFDARGMLSYVNSVVSNLTALQQSYIGVPEAIESQVSAYVTLGATTPYMKANQLAQREPHILVTFAYRVEGSESTAELLICDLVDALTSVIYADRTLGGTTHTVEMDMSMNANPAYMAVAGSEFRRYIVLLKGSQQQSVP